MARRATVAASLVTLAGCVAEPVFTGSGGGGGTSTDAASGSTSDGATTATSQMASASTGAGSVCGDWTVQPDEACEDGNMSPGDGCSPACQLEATCGNMIVEPGEPCDDGPSGGANCDPACQLASSSACFGAPAFQYGTFTVTGGPDLGPFDQDAPCGTIRSVGYLDTGPVPMRVTARFRGGTGQMLVRQGCTGPVLVACASAFITPLLPAHTVGWLGIVVPNEGQMRTVQVNLTRWGSFFSGPDGMTNEGVLPWVHSTANNGEWTIQTPDASQGILVSPELDLRGVPSPAAHFGHTFVAGSGAVAELQYSTDGTSWTPAVAYVANEDSEDEEIPLPMAANMDSVQVRFVMNGAAQGSWALRNLFVGPPFGPAPP